MTKINGLVEYCYVGVLTQSTWHRIGDLHKLYIELRHYIPKSRLKIITTSSHEAIKKNFSLLPEGEIVITRTKNTDELKKELKTVDFGLLSYRESKSLQEDIVGDSILGTKTAGYIAAGLPIIVNINCGGAAKIVDKYNLGLSYYPNTFEKFAEANICRYLIDERFDQRSKLAKELFSYSSNATMYRSVYGESFNLDC